jgi:hypothetical protein
MKSMHGAVVMLHTCVDIFPRAITLKLGLMKAFNVSLDYLHVA